MAHVKTATSIRRRASHSVLNSFRRVSFSASRKALLAIPQMMEIKFRVHFIEEFNCHLSHCAFSILSFLSIHADSYGLQRKVCKPKRFAHPEERAQEIPEGEVSSRSSPEG